MPWFLAFSCLSRMFLGQLHSFSCFLIAILFDRESIGIGLVYEEFVWKLKFDFNDDADYFNNFLNGVGWWKWLSRFTDL